MENQIIIYGKDSAGTITPITLQGTGQNTTINYLESIESASDRGTEPSPRVNNENLFYNTSTSKWDSRGRESYSINISGGMIALAANTFYDILPQSGNGNFNSITSRTNFSTNSAVTWSGTTLSGFVSTKTYMIMLNVGTSSWNIGTSPTLLTFDIVVNGNRVAQGTHSYDADGSYGSSHPCSWVGTGVSNVRARIFPSAATAIGFRDPNTVINLQIIEL